jgi:hypothetical protein
MQHGSGATGADDGQVQRGLGRRPARAAVFAASSRVDYEQITRRESSFVN